MGGAQEPIRGSGSSPLARGLRHMRSPDAPGGGIIPARAGFTVYFHNLRFDRDHPRSRGVYHDGEKFRIAFRGSSPLARGLLGRRPRTHTRIRIIPARAGFTPYAVTRCARWRDHPRSRGVYRLFSQSSVRRQGSSPLARGLLMSRCVGLCARRIIPARAGFTPPPTRPAAGFTDHPRSRGVYSAPDSAALSAEGSSPLARGLRSARRCARSCPRIIPARAGFTRAHPQPC